MEHPGPEQVYHSNLYDSVPARHPLRDLLRNARRGRQRVRYLDGGVRSKVPDSLPTLLSWADGQRGYAVCLIENIRPEWMASLGVAWGLDLSFFVDYAGTRDDGSVWDSVMVPDFHLTDEHSAPQRQWYIEGVLSNLRPDASRQSRVRRRAEFENVSYGLQATTRISYCRVNHRLCE